MADDDDSIHIFTGHTGEIYTVICSPTDASLLATGGGDDRGFMWRINQEDWAFELDKKLIVWGQHSSPRCICAHEDAVTCLVSLGGSKYVATGCVDGKVRIWDGLSGDCAKELGGHSDAIMSIATSSTGEFLVSISLDGTARVFEIAEFTSQIHEQLAACRLYETVSQ